MEEKKYLKRNFVYISIFLLAVAIVALFVAAFGRFQNPVPVVIFFVCLLAETALGYWGTCCPYCGYPEAGMHAFFDNKWSWECCPKCRHELEFAPPKNKPAEE